MLSSAPPPRCSSHTPGPAASGSVAIPVDGQRQTHPAPVIAADPDGVNTVEADWMKPNEPDDALHGISTSASVVDEGAGPPRSSAA